MITTVTLGQTAVLQFLSGGAIVTPMPIHISNAPTMPTLNPTGFEISSALTMASLRWMGVALAVQDWSQSSMDPAKQTVVAEGVSMFMEEMGSLMGRTSPDEEDDHDNHDKKDGSCIRSSSGLPFFGNIFKTISCVVGMASDISHTFDMLIKGAMDVQTAISTSAAQMAAIVDVIKFMANPSLNTRPATPPPSLPSTSNVPHVTESAHASTSMPLSNSEISTDISRSSTSVSSSVSSSMACALPTSVIDAFTGESYARKPFCPRFQPCGVSCKTCLQDIYVESMEGSGGGMGDGAYNRSVTFDSAILAQLDRPESTTEEGINAFMRSKFADAKHALETNNEERVFVPHGHTGTEIGKGVPSALFRKYDDAKMVLGLVNLYGCTSVLVVSKSAIWWSHFWELPGFLALYDEESPSDGWYNTWDEPLEDEEEGNPSIFRTYVLDVLESTKSCSMDEEPKSFLSLACHVDKAFAEGEEPRVIVITPRSSYGSELAYPNHINAIRSVLRDNVFKDVSEYDDNHVVVVAYDRGMGEDPNANPPHEGGDPEKYSWLDGKFMLQFDPQHEPDRAALELWAEQSSQPVFSTQWSFSQTVSITTTSPPTTTPSNVSTTDPSSFATIVTPLASSVPRPGISGIPGCAYVIAENGQRCIENYCNCGGTVAPLLTMTVSGTLELNCEYSTQPSWNRCPGDPTASPKSTSASLTTPSPTPSPLYEQGICRLHIKESTRRRGPAELTLAVFDNSGHAPLSSSHHDAMRFGDIAVIEGSNTILGYPIEVHLGDPEQFEDVYDSLNIVITFGDVATVSFRDQDASKYPHCNVGGWDRSFFNLKAPVSSSTISRA